MPVSGYLAPESTARIPATAFVLGMTLPLSMWPGGNHQLRLGAFIPTVENNQRMSLFLWLVRSAWSVGITPVMETVVDVDATVTLGIDMAVAFRLFVPVQHEDRDVLLATMRGTVEADADGAPPGGGPRASWRTIDSVTAFMDAHEAMTGTAMAVRFTQLAFNTPMAGPDPDSSSEEEDSDLEEAGQPAGGRGTFSANSPVTLLGVDRVFTEVLREVYCAGGVHPVQVDPGQYIGHQELLFSDGVMRDICGRPLAYRLAPGLHGVVSDADELLNFASPWMQPKMNELRVSYEEKMLSSGMEVPPAVYEATTIESLEAAFVSPAGGPTVRSSLLKSPEWPDLIGGGGEFDHAARKIWGMQCTVEHRNAKICDAVRMCLRAEKITVAIAQRVVRRQLRHAALLTSIGLPTPGVKPAFTHLWRDLRRLSADVETEGAGEARREAAATAHRIFTHVPAGVDGCSLPPGSAYLVQLALVAQRMLNMTMAQVVAFVPIWVSGCSMLRNVWGLQTSWTIIGPPDTGKSHVAAAVLKCTVDSFRNQAHQTSAKVATRNRAAGFHWQDEQAVNRAPAGGKKAALQTSDDLWNLQAGALGYGAYRRFRLGDPSRGVPDRVDEIYTDLRGHNILCSNERSSAAQESRTNLILVANRQQDATLPTRQELTLTPAGPAQEGAAMALQLYQAYANIAWRPQAFGFLETGSLWLLAVRIFNGLVNAMLVPHGFPAVPPRGLKKLEMQAIAVMRNRLSREFEVKHATLRERNRTRDEFMMRWSVVSLADAAYAWIFLMQLGDTRREEAEIMRTLKAGIKVNPASLETEFVRSVENNKYYVTSVRGGSGLSEQCEGLGAGIVSTVIGKLKVGTEGSARIMEGTVGDEKGCLCVLMEAVNTPTCLTAVQQKVVAFLERVITTPPSGGPRLWYPVVGASGEETGEIAFTLAVNDALLRPVHSALFKGWAGATMQADVQVAFDMFVQAGLMRNTDGTHNALSVAVHSPIQIGTALSTAATGGILDPTTVLAGVPEYEAHTGPYVTGELQTWSAGRPPATPGGLVRAPGLPPRVAPLTIHGALVVSGKVVQMRQAVERAKFIECNMLPPVHESTDAAMEQALHKFISMVMLASGEAEVGQWVFGGASMQGDRPYTLLQIADVPGPVWIDNPNRAPMESTDAMMSAPSASDTAYPDNPEDAFLPRSAPRIKIETGMALRRRIEDAYARTYTEWLL